MNLNLIAQNQRVAEFQQAVREEFARTGSPRNMMIVAIFTIGFLLLCFLLWRLQQRISGARQTNSPKQLFRDLIRRLQLTFQQRRLLRRVAQNAKLENPAAILLSPALFDQAVGQWQTQLRVSDRRRLAIRAGLARLRSNLFPKSRGGQVRSPQARPPATNPAPKV